VGPFVVAAVYVTAGTLASLVSISARPLTVSVGDSGAIFGLYGLLIASSLWGMFHRSAMTIPLHTVKRLGPSAAVFVLYSLASDSLPVSAGLTGLVAGLAYGLVLARGVADRKEQPRWVAAAMGAAGSRRRRQCRCGNLPTSPEWSGSSRPGTPLEAYQTAAGGSERADHRRGAGPAHRSNAIMPELQASRARRRPGAARIAACRERRG
jgi:hypothetical protein